MRTIALLIVYTFMYTSAFAACPKGIIRVTKPSGKQTSWVSDNCVQSLVRTQKRVYFYDGETKIVMGYDWKIEILPPEKI